MKGSSVEHSSQSPRRGNRSLHSISKTSSEISDLHCYWSDYEKNAPNGREVFLLDRVVMSNNESLISGVMAGSVIIVMVACSVSVLSGREDDSQRS